MFFLYEKYTQFIQFDINKTLKNAKKKKIPVQASEE